MTLDSASTDDGYNPAAWHDDTLHGLSIFTGDIDNDDWRSELNLDIDHIVEWIRQDDGYFVFDVVPATLSFHDVTDLDIALAWSASGFQDALSQADIDRIERSVVANQRICLDRPYYRWRIIFNTPEDGRIEFGATGYTLKPRGAPVRQASQTMLSVNRPPMIPGGG